MKCVTITATTVVALTASTSTNKKHDSSIDHQKIKLSTKTIDNHQARQLITNRRRLILPSDASTLTDFIKELLHHASCKLFCKKKKPKHQMPSIQATRINSGHVASNINTVCDAANNRAWDASDPNFMSINWNKWDTVYKHSDIIIDSSTKTISTTTTGPTGVLAEQPCTEGFKCKWVLQITQADTNEEGDQTRIAITRNNCQQSGRQQNLCPVAPNESGITLLAQKNYHDGIRKSAWCQMHLYERLDMRQSFTSTQFNNICFSNVDDELIIELDMRTSGNNKLSFSDSTGPSIWNHDISMYGYTKGEWYLYVAIRKGIQLKMKESSRQTQPISYPIPLYLDSHGYVEVSNNQIKNTMPDTQFPQQIVIFDQVCQVYETCIWKFRMLEMSAASLYQSIAYPVQIILSTDSDMQRAQSIRFGWNKENSYKKLKQGIALLNYERGNIVMLYEKGEKKDWLIPANFKDKCDVWEIILTDTKIRYILNGVPKEYVFTSPRTQPYQLMMNFIQGMTIEYKHWKQ